MRVARFLAPLALVSITACSSGGGHAVQLDNEDQKTWYALGAMMGQQAVRYDMTPEQADIAKEGFADAASKRTMRVDLSAYGPKVSELARAKMEEARKKQAAEALVRAEKDKPFVEAAKAEKGAEALPSGLVYRSITDGKGESPKATDYISAGYTGKLSDGTVFDSSEKHGGPQKFFLNRVVPCWTEGVQKMKVGGKASLTCPANIAYGDRGSGAIPGGAALQFEIELVAIEQPPAQPTGNRLPIPLNMHPNSAPSAAPTKAASATK